MLWSFQTGAGANDSPTFFEQDGKEYVAFYSAGNSLQAIAARRQLLALQPRRHARSGCRARGKGTGTEHAGEGGGAATAGDAAAGKAVFADNCATCHGSLGTGGNGGPDLTSIPSAKTGAVVTKQVTNGGGGMPAFKGTLTEQQIARRRGLRHQEHHQQEQVGLSRVRQHRHLRTILGAATLAGVAALASPPIAGATTGIEATVPVRVTLSDSGVSFSPKLHPDTNTTLVVRVINRSSSPRTFTFGFRWTPPLKKGSAVLFYYTFHIAGKVSWRSHAAGGKTFAGLTKVSIAKMFSGGG